MIGYHHHQQRLDRIILQRLWDGQRMTVITKELGLPHASAERIKRRLFELAGATTAVGLARYALREGWIRL